MISYRIDVADANAHQFAVALQVPAPAAVQLVSVPAWIPGSYLVREFARHLSRLRARQGGRDIEPRQLDKATWAFDCDDADGAAPLQVDYRVYAFDTSVRAAFLDADRGFFNGTSVFLRVHGREHEPHALVLGALPDGWQAATALPESAEAGDAGGDFHYAAADYDELVDHPFELGRFWHGEFDACGVPHEFVVAGALPRFDGGRLLADAKRVCEAHIRFWHGADAGPAEVPFARYVFFLNAVDDGYGGLEHRAGTALIAARRDLPRRGEAAVSDGYATLLGLVSHEYFHAWNVKRMKPAEFSRIDYAAENYTALLWFFEGFTSYYDDLLLLRSGLIDEARYLKLLAKTVTAVLAAPGRRVQSVAQASFDAWVKYYRGDENTPNSTVSYYAKGSLVALALDLGLRSGEGAGGASSLDAVMRALWQQRGGGPIDEADILRAVREAVGGGRGDEVAASLRDWVHGTGDLPLEPLLDRAGIAWSVQPPTLAQRWGLRIAESPLTGIRVNSVLSGGAGEQAGLSAGDELLAVAGWRMRRLDDALAVIDDGAAVPLLVSRDQRVLTLAVPAGAAAGPGAVQLAARPGDAEPPPAADRAAPPASAPATALALRRAWLHG